MRAVLVELHAANQELLRAYRIRANNHQELLSCLKDVNQMIQKAARLRGTPFSRLPHSSQCGTLPQPPPTPTISRSIQKGWGMKKRMQHGTRTGA